MIWSMRPTTALILTPSDIGRARPELECDCVRPVALALV
jgi:hypothetical protein